MVWSLRSRDISLIYVLSRKAVERGNRGNRCWCLKSLSADALFHHLDSIFSQRGELVNFIASAMSLCIFNELRECRYKQKYHLLRSWKPHMAFANRFTVAWPCLRLPALISECRYNNYPGRVVEWAKRREPNAIIWGHSSKVNYFRRDSGDQFTEWDLDARCRIKWFPCVRHVFCATGAGSQWAVLVLADGMDGYSFTCFLVKMQL